MTKMNVENVKKEKKVGNIYIAYPIPEIYDGFLSRKVYETEFLRLHSRYLDILELPKEYIVEGYELDPEPDYLLVNIDVWGLELFVLREQGKINTPFLIYLHVIYGQDIYISYMLPLLREEDIVVVASECSKKCLLKISQQFNNVHVIPLSIDVEEISQIVNEGSKYKPSNKKVISYIGQLLPEKGIGELLECMPRIITNVRNVSLNIIGPLSGTHIGGGKSRYVQKLEKRITDLKISDYVNWKGILLGKEKFWELSQSDILINPSIFKMETFGLVNIEALACGLPVICTCWEAYNEIISEGKNGFFVDLKEDEAGRLSLNCNQLISIVSGLLKYDNLLEEMKKEAKKAALNYHYRVLVPKLVKLLKKKCVDFEGQWDRIKYKNFLDFRFLFQKDWLSVICADSIKYRCYDEIIRFHGLGIDFSKKTRYEIFKYLYSS